MATSFVFSQQDQSEDNHRFQQQQGGKRNKSLSGLACEDVVIALQNMICQFTNLTGVHS